MIPQTLHRELIAGLRDGSIVPCLGPGILADVVSKNDGRPMPATGEQLILAMNGGRPMAPKLMYEFPRAAMNIELKRGRSAVTRFLDATYGGDDWSRAAAHDWLAGLLPDYVIDINRDAQLLDSYAGRPHTLVLGCARLGGGDFRFRLYANDGRDYAAITPEQADASLPVLFKPMGAPKPQSCYIASDADYVDYITELMGGFAVPSFVKHLRQGKRYLLLGLRFNRDTERMVMAELLHGADARAGWALISAPSDNERRFCARLGLELIDADAVDLIGALAAA